MGDAPGLHDPVGYLLFDAGKYDLKPHYCLLAGGRPASFERERSAGEPTEEVIVPMGA